ncbi:NUDIX domain-containing protein [Symbioplanes lichenis]|uniref:NUDIX domain-containing protein n=1 Tax=Symbioplanes lichenis TaxID=1629072 RepID=UPI00273A0260|nr:NUDIX domain-containing protein [Actinoplanes lichenis]
MPDRYAHCTFCGARFTPGQPWPRRCAACGETSYLNPKPVAVALQPVGAGLLVIRRAVPPAADRLALPGGFMETGETWEESVARELAEETGVRADPADVRLFDAVSAPDGTLLIFGLLPALASVADLPEHADDETRGREVLTRPEPLGFELHTRAANRWFEQIAAGF